MQGRDAWRHSLYHHHTVLDLEPLLFYSGGRVLVVGAPFVVALLPYLFWQIHGVLGSCNAHWYD